MGFQGAIRIFNINRDGDGRERLSPNFQTEHARVDFCIFAEPSEPAHMFNPIGSKATVCAFSYVPSRIVTGHMSGKVAIFDYKTGEEVDNNERAHGDEVTDLQMALDRTYFVTSSKDKAARVSRFSVLRYSIFGRRKIVYSSPIHSCIKPRTSKS